MTSPGHSLGSLTALLEAAAVPERVEAHILDDPPLPLPAAEAATCVSQTANAVFEAMFLGVSRDIGVPVREVSINDPTLSIRASDPEQRALVVDFLGG